MRPPSAFTKQMFATWYFLTCAVLFIGLIAHCIDDPKTIPCQTRGVCCGVAAFFMVGFFALIWPLVAVFMAAAYSRGDLKLQ